MKLFITAHYTGNDNDAELESLREAVRKSGMDDFCFAQDIKQTFESQKDLWKKALDKIVSCDALLIDVSDVPSGGRIVEVGIAFGLHKPIFVIAKNNVEYKPMYYGLATQVIKYNNYTDIIKPLSDYLAESRF